MWLKCGNLFDSAGEVRVADNSLKSLKHGMVPYCHYTLETERGQMKNMWTCVLRFKYEINQQKFQHR